MCFNSSPERRVPSPNRYMAVASFCFCKNNKRTIIIMCLRRTETQADPSLPPGLRVRAMPRSVAAVSGVLDGTVKKGSLT